MSGGASAWIDLAVLNVQAFLEQSSVQADKTSQIVPRSAARHFNVEFLQFVCRWIFSLGKTGPMYVRALSSIENICKVFEHNQSLFQSGVHPERATVRFSSIENKRLGTYHILKA